MSDELLGILLSWAAHLSGYPVPTDVPELSYEPHAFFVEHVCGGRECKVEGWYNDRNIVYIDEKYEQSDDSFGVSLIVHEFTHHLQYLSKKFGGTCSDFLARENEAYLVQNRYLMEATTLIRHAGMRRGGCKKE
jgi:hypothetical protein